MSLTSTSNRNAKKFRIVFLGDQGVGKTSIIQRYSTDRFDENYNVSCSSFQSTVGIDFNVKDVNKNGLFYRLQMWDTAGQERYRSLIPTYLKNAHCVVFVFDVTNPNSLKNLQDWYKLFADNQQAPGIVIGNKTDLTAARQIDRIEGQKFSKQLNLKYLQVSAKNGRKIYQLFDLVIDCIAEKQRQENFGIKDQSNKQMNQINALELGRKRNSKIQLKNDSFFNKIERKCCQQN